MGKAKTFQIDPLTNCQKDQSGNPDQQRHFPAKQAATNGHYTEEYVARWPAEKMKEAMKSSYHDSVSPSCWFLGPKDLDLDHVVLLQPRHLAHHRLESGRKTQGESPLDISSCW